MGWWYFFCMGLPWYQLKYFNVGRRIILHWTVYIQYSLHRPIALRTSRELVRNVLRSNSYSPCSLTKYHIIQYEESVAFYSLRRMKDDYTIYSHLPHLIIRPFKKLGECNFSALGVKGLNRFLFVSAQMADYERANSKDSEVNPKRTAGLFSLLTFSWMSSMLATGAKRPLDNSDLFPPLDEDKTQEVTHRLEQTWGQELKQYTPSGGIRGWRLFRAVLRAFRWNDYALVLCTGLIRSLSIVLQPLFLSLLLLNLMDQSTEDSRMAYLWGAAICISSSFKFAAMHHFDLQSYVMSMRLKAAISGLIYKTVKDVELWHQLVPQDVQFPQIRPYLLIS